MYILLLAAATGLFVWSLYAPGARFLPAMAGLLGDAHVRQSPFTFFSGRAYATGSFRDREVALRLQLKRHRYAPGYLVIAMRLDRPLTLGDAGIEARTHDERARRALSALSNDELRLGAEDGWLKAQWKPQGFTVFPGRFSEARWRAAFDSLHIVADAIDASAAAR